MARYYFVIEQPDGEIPDDSGADFHDEQEAKQFADRLVEDLKGGRGYDTAGWTLSVRTELGDVAFEVPFGPTH